MKNINIVFFEEFKKLDKLCGDMYGTKNGVTNYIDNMKNGSWNNYHSITNWEADLNQLRRLRHIRNNLAHMEGAFDENLCTQDDIEWIRTFYKRIFNQTDPLAMQYRNLKFHIRKTGANTSNSQTYKLENTQNNQTYNLENMQNNQTCDLANTEKKMNLSAMIINFVIIAAVVIIVLAVLTLM